MKEERKNNKIYYESIIIAIIIILSIGVSYAWFTSKIVKNPNLVTNGTLQIKYTEGSNINASNLKPATTAQVLEAYKNGSCIYKQDREQGITNEHICAYNTFTITNTGTLYAKTDISIKNIINTYSSNIKYMLFENTPEELTINNLKGVIILEKNILIPPKTNNSKTYTLLIWLDENADNYDFNKEYSGNIYAEAIETNMPNLDKSKANKPVLAEGMIPVYYNEELNNWVKADINNEDEANQWYDYQNKMWANAVMVKTDDNDSYPTKSRSEYMSASAGTIVYSGNILAYYVWIPRYKYQLFNVDFIEANYIYDHDADSSICTANCPQVIDVVFEKGTSTTGTVTCTHDTNGNETCTNKENGNWYTHPAFTFGDTELEGIWVGKFKTTGSETAPAITPDDPFSRSITVANMYSTGKLFRSADYMTSNGINQSDSHMMKNIEWGAVAYLKQSNYGLGITDIEINHEGETGGRYYKTNTGQSTTGNIYGVYDMNGEIGEYVMGNYAKTAGESGLNVNEEPAEHIDIYSGDDVSASHLGDATGETVGWYSGVDWYSNYAGFVSSSSPWFMRGEGLGDNDDYMSGVFGFGKNTGEADYFCGFRVVLSVTK